MSITEKNLINLDNLQEVNRQELKAPVYLRPDTSDLATYNQVFTNQEYDFITNIPPKVIVDAGANIGLASVYFANKYPESKIIAIEPEESNFELLKKNILPYDNIIPLHAALWDKNEEINLVDPGLGKWGFMTEEKESQEKTPADLCHQIQGMTVDKIIEDYDLSRIDILKIDIEGAEREVFNDSSSWIENVNAMIVELHERMKSGCNRSFYNGSNGFDNEWFQGENVYLSRSNNLTRRSGVKPKISVSEQRIKNRDKTIEKKDNLISKRNDTLYKIRKSRLKLVRIRALFHPIKKYKAYKSLMAQIGKTKS